MKCVAWVLLVMLATGCAVQKKQSTQRYMPNEVGPKIAFGMSLDAFMQIKKGADISSDDSDEFRTVVIEEVSQNQIEAIVYYFDADGNKPLYEVIIVFKTEVARDEVAQKLLGGPNYGDEWQFPGMQPYQVNAWTYKNKLIVVAIVPGCEWDEDENNQ